MKEIRNQNRHIADEVQKTLESMDSLPHVEPSPYFAIRLNQAIQAREEVAPEWFYQLTLGFKLVPAGLALLAVLNLASLAVGLSAKNSSSTVEITPSQISNDYTLQTWDYTSNPSGR